MLSLKLNRLTFFTPTPQIAYGLGQGVAARETSDGLEIDGRPDLVIDTPVVVRCEGDHRMAMSFAVLATRFPNIIIGACMYALALRLTVRPSLYIFFVVLDFDFVFCSFLLGF